MAKAFEIPGFNPDASLDECISLMVKARTREVESFRRGLSAKTVDAVHDMRVSCRRLQTILIIFDDSLKKNTRKKFNKKLQGLAQVAGQSQAIRRRHGNRFSSHGDRERAATHVADLFMARFRAKRFKAMQKALKAFRNFASDPLYKRYVSAACDADCPSPARNRRRNKNALFPLVMREFISKLLADFLNGAELALAEVDDPSALHAMRIRGKPLRYAMETALPFLKKGFNDYYLEIKDMIEELGTIHDIDVACLELRRFDKELYFFNTSAPGRETVCLEQR